MITEGKGRVAPSPIAMSLGRGELLGLFDHAKERARYRGYANKSNQWSQGLKDSMQDRDVGEIARAVRPIYCGLIGEWAVCKLIERRTGLNIYPDLSLKRTGDHGVDITARLSMQVKTRQTERMRNLIRVEFRDGISLVRTCDVHVFCEWTGGRIVRILGWLWTHELKGREVVAGRGDWWNVEPEDKDLRPMARLIDEIKSREGKE